MHTSSKRPRFVRLPFSAPSGCPLWFLGSVGRWWLELVGFASFLWPLCSEAVKGAGLLDVEHWFCLQAFKTLQASSAGACR